VKDMKRWSGGHERRPEIPHTSVIHAPAVARVFCSRRHRPVRVGWWYERCHKRKSSVAAYHAPRRTGNAYQGEGGVVAATVSPAIAHSSRFSVVEGDGLFTEGRKRCVWRRRRQAEGLQWVEGGRGRSRKAGGWQVGGRNRHSKNI